MLLPRLQAFLPQAAELLVDEDPIPLYALKLLSAVMERSPALAMEAEPLGLLPLTVQFLRLDHPNNNIHNLRLIEALVQCGTMTMSTGGSTDDSCVSTLYSLGLAESLVAVLDYAYENQVDSFFESVLGIVLCLLSIDGDGAGDVHQWNTIFCDAMECLLALLGTMPSRKNMRHQLGCLTDTACCCAVLIRIHADHADGGVGELAAACLVALVKQTPSTSTRALETLAQPLAIDALAKALVSNNTLNVICCYRAHDMGPLLAGSHFTLIVLAYSGQAIQLCRHNCLCVLQDGADAAVQSLVLDLALRLARGGVGTSQWRSLARAAARLADGGDADTDPNVVSLAAQLVAEAGPV